MPDEMSLPRAASPSAARWPFDNSYARLPERFYARLAPTPVAAPRLVKLNRRWPLQLGLDPELLASAGGRRGAGRQPRARGRRADRAGLCRTPVRQLRAAARRRARASCSARSSTATACAATSSSRARAARPSRAAATAARRSARCCANTSSARRWHALGIPTTRALAAVTTGEPVDARDRAARRGADPRGRRATSASAPSSSSPRAATSRRCGCSPTT